MPRVALSVLLILSGCVGLQDLGDHGSKQADSKRDAGGEGPTGPTKHAGSAMDSGASSSESSPMGAANDEGADAALPTDAAVPTDAALPMDDASRPASPFSDTLIDEMKMAIAIEWPDDTILDVQITEDDWTVYANQFGRIEYRMVWTHVTSRQMRTEGPYCAMYEVSFIEPSTDGVTYRRVQYESVGQAWEQPCTP